jgi:hypothetical protein
MMRDNSEMAKGRELKLNMNERDNFNELFRLQACESIN